MGWLVTIETTTPARDREKARAFYADVLRHLDAHEEALDADFDGELRNGPVRFHVAIADPDWNTSAKAANDAVRHAIHAAGGATGANWPTSDDIDDALIWRADDGDGFVLEFQGSSQRILDNVLV